MKQNSLDTETFVRIRKWYLLALAGIALSIIIAQILIQTHLTSQLDDSRVINVAGRQRALSQKLVKEILLLEEIDGLTERADVIEQIRETLNLWEASHLGLQRGNAALKLPQEKDLYILQQFKQLDPYHHAMIQAAEKVLNLSTGDTKTYSIEKATILSNERPFLTLMDKIVNTYDIRSKTKLQNLKTKEYWLLAFSLSILLLEIVLIFKPLSIQIRQTILNLVNSQFETNQKAQEISNLLLEKEKSLRELQELNYVIDNAALFASARRDGTIVFISKKFTQLLGLKDQKKDQILSEALTTDEGQQTYLNELFKGNRKNHIRNEEIQITTLSNRTIWLDISIIPMHRASKQQSILILCFDITERKQNALKLELLTQQNFEESLLQKKNQASQIVESQEEERKRIAKDIHDGIGQMLTALRFNIESIEPSNIQKTEEKIEYLKNLTADLIKGVRTATFNLTPPELTDYGIFPAIQKMTLELSKLTGRKILYENKTETNIRFSSLAETNLYRVTQEAVNNAVKYAEADYILVTVNYSNQTLSIVIDDNGKGFDLSALPTIPANNSEGGMGVFFMKERISYINGRIFIHSELGSGTRITINYKEERTV